jgi:hypothetical protein
MDGAFLHIFIVSLMKVPVGLEIWGWMLLFNSTSDCPIPFPCDLIVDTWTSGE